ncbi:hypothetical protein A2230_00200 [candidate division WOR-1 bacterium RIFOXYA2_FULL_36_21]|uniref:Uncharacterized protein n=1 Tax=candidate division WOR-1 bacterium RIFOXYB2_FULL_36_35 TaxID=1802578 RepID=A0A1F4S027_UNCSA|nr:MAG: hypothetical protein A2230_00200 [candidate division WOR-1 bacterium RIFOXYA2_FULL_36_21]OGC13747.1 MAG: hypothetical protein A2290_07730 [candidate division WOR-1 bacterium RIFOXYB2_FULL_36_35]OGC14470.1 MAG: hypothetical protein A2282_08730 [candidate division WOR-1 bacterium RIFOXYA12_FULL_36_13]
MPTVKMQKVLICGTQENKDTVIKKLHELGVIELTETNLQKEENTKNEDYELAIAEVAAAISFLEKAAQIKKSFVESFAPTKKTIHQEVLINAYKKTDWKETVKKIKTIEGELANIRNLKSKLETDIDNLTPWQSLNFNLDLENKLKRTIIIFAEYGKKDKMAAEKKLEDKKIFFDISVVSSAGNKEYAAIIVLKENEKEVLDILNENRFQLRALPYANCCANEELKKLRQAFEEMIYEKKELEKEALSLSTNIENLTLVYDYLLLKKQEKEAKGFVNNTKRAYTMSGWIKKKEREKLLNTLLNLSKEIDVIPVLPGENEIIPTAIENPPMFKPFELITKIFGVPGTKEVDPTQALSFFYIVFFAICLSDAAYGAILAIASFYFLKKLTLSEGGKNLLLLLFWGGILSIAAGILTGSYFAINLDDLPKSSIKDALLYVKIIDPVKSPLTMLIASLAMGVIQNIWGLIVGMYWKIKQKEYLAGIFDFGLWIFFLLALVALLIANAIGPNFVSLTSYLSMAGAIMLVLTQGRNEPGFIKKAIGGILSLYRTTAFLGDTLSYSRLLALMMTTSIIGLVVNILAGITATSIPIFGYVIMIVILVVGHLFNLVVSVLGAFVHSMRLQLVEFFGKFYEGSGRPFKPLGRETKYVVIK